MKVASKWRDLPDLTPQRHNRFDIFADNQDETPTVRTNSVGGEFRLSGLPKAPQTSNEIPSRIHDLLGSSRRNSVPTALNGPKKPSLPRYDSVARRSSPERVPHKTSTQTQEDRRPESPGPDSVTSGQTGPPARTKTTPFSLWDYLQLELAATDTDEAHDFKRERVRNFLMLPDALERTLMFGFLVCLDSFLYIFTILPVRFIRSTFSLSSRLLRTRSSLKSSEKVDLLKGGLILLTCVVLNQLDASRIYHNIRGQAAIKLYVLYNVLEIGDKLFCALGQDILDCLFSKSTFGRKEDGSRRHLRPLAFLVLALAYNVLHTVLLFYQLVTLNVTVNSFSNALMTLLLSNQFVEIKGSVFKKFEKEGLFQITCADMVERFQLFIMLLIIGLRNTFEMSPSSPVDVLTTAFGPMVTVLGSEVLVDWLKHAFITKFNHVRPTIYSRFTDVLCRDYVKSAGIGENTYVDQSPAISRRIGLPVLPLICLTLRSAGQIVTMFLDRDDSAFQDPPPPPSPTTIIELDVITSSITSTSHWEPRTVAWAWYLLIALLVFSTLLIAKLSLGVSLIRFAHGRYGQMQAREEQEGRLEAERKKRAVYKGLVEVDGDTKAILNNVADNLKGMEGQRGLLGLDRYSMISKRIW